MGQLGADTAKLIKSIPDLVSYVYWLRSLIMSAKQFRYNFLAVVSN